MRSIGINLGRWINKGLLQFHAARPTTFGLEMHLVKMDLLRLELETEEEESRRLIGQEQMKLKKWERDQGKMAKSRALNEGTRDRNAKKRKRE